MSATPPGDLLGDPHDGPRHERERGTAEASRDRFAFLAEVSRCLADSLDYETTLVTVAGMSLRYLGAWCIVDLCTADGGIRRVRHLERLDRLPDDRFALEIGKKFAWATRHPPELKIVHRR